MPSARIYFNDRCHLYAGMRAYHRANFREILPKYTLKVQYRRHCETRDNREDRYIGNAPTII